MDGRSWRGPRHFHIVMSRILSPGYRLILCANKPFRPGVKLSVTPERSPTRSLCRRSRRRRCRRRRAARREDIRETIRACVEKVGSGTSVNGCKLARKTAGTRARSVQKKRASTNDTTVSCLRSYAGEKDDGDRVEPRCFFISSGPARLVIIDSIDQFVRSSGEKAGVKFNLSFLYCVWPVPFGLRERPVFMLMKKRSLSTINPLG